VDLAPGLYEALVTLGLKERLDELPDSGLVPDVGRVDEAEVAEVLGRHLGDVLTRQLLAAKSGDRLTLANRILEALGGEQAEAETIPDPPQQLRGITKVAPGVYRITERPEIPLSRSDLLVNGRGEPGLGRSIAAEIHSADRIDILSAFIKWTGLRLVLDQLEAAIRRGVKVRVLTTTYLGATQRRALDHLVRLGAEVHVNYETRSTRLHAKAWLFDRDTGYHTAYVRSSNLSKAALVDGLEWNVRLSSVETPHLVEKFRATFESYWADERHGFEPYDPERDADRLDRALLDAGGQAPEPGVIMPAFEIRPYPFQQEILEQLDAEREVHDRWRNLVVAATGTGKTVVAALDFKRLRARLGGDPSLLFVAHRREILRQSRATFAAVLGDGGFGEMYVGGARPERWQHVFASVQSLAQLHLDDLRPDLFDVVIVDEFHHAEAPTYTRLLNHLDPRVLLGLTATPERTDAGDVARWFDGHIAAELRLWEALERDLLCPFHYFGVHDETDLSNITWRRGTYDTAELDNVISGSQVRALIVVNAVRDKVASARGMRALGFCVSKQHAHFMARFFRDSGIPAVAVDADTPTVERDNALRQLRDCEVNAIFAVDLFNEGVDVPEIDTVLLLRPTESATVFLQQLGRGLRRADDKDVLTVLDLIGFQHKRFRFDMRYRALTGVTRRGLVEAVQHGFPFLPPGCHIELDRYAQDAVLQNLKDQVRPTAPGLVKEIREYGNLSLAQYLTESGRELTDVYGGNRSWTGLRRSAGLPTADAGPREEELLKRVRALLHVDDPQRVAAYRTLVESADSVDIDSLSMRDQRLAAMLFFSLWPSGGKLGSYEEGLRLLAQHPAVPAEILEVLNMVEERIAHVPVAMTSPAFADVPLFVHARYSREELLAGLGYASLERVPRGDMVGVRFVEALQADVFTFTLQKAESEYSPTTMYRDYAISPSLIHWETQSTTSVESKTGQRYLNHRDRGTHILLFARETKQYEVGAAPYLFLGPATYVRYEGSRPIAITWRLEYELPADFYQRARLLAG
jgi:superfamily II DNA or RNA helicase/HKD family nuclease